MCLSVAEAVVPVARGLPGVIKRLLDIFVSAIGLCVLLPVMGLIALWLLVAEGPPPVRSSLEPGAASYHLVADAATRRG